MKEKKDWGHTECIVANPFMQLHRIEVVPHGYCSIHSHKYRSNTFYVERGVLRVDLLDSEGMLVRGHLLWPGQHLTIGPGILHSFSAMLEPVVAFEAYFPEAVQSDDIDRKTVGGVHP